MAGVGAEVVGEAEGATLSVALIGLAVGTPLGLRVGAVEGAWELTVGTVVGAVVHSFETVTASEYPSISQSRARRAARAAVLPSFVSDRTQGQTSIACACAFVGTLKPGLRGSEKSKNGVRIGTQAACVFKSA